ncbi:GNAT family N-acetyltransferase [Roseovarius rhodophyticola]|uniref:GNAT family N-acetyltransferase n=1 Tax=Roseovarius rhodophyticola TaxID=3080827 RepID=A0ABZ2TIS7_9RHOB|nr:GNAT family N-acetyltransferase [Roseovarius sp. W115]MDV2928248.1 GNAT family N-acetyltransferase [Roseovarius sp. W115]
MSETVYATTDRLIWRAATLADLDALHAIASEFEVVRQTSTWPWPADRDFTASRCQPMPRDEGLGGVVTSQGEVIGMMGLDHGKMGYMFAPAHWGKGYATELGHAAIDVIFARYDWSRIEACVFDDNPASGRVLEKLGFARVGPCEGPSAARGGVFPIINYALPRPQA